LLLGISRGKEGREGGGREGGREEGGGRREGGIDPSGPNIPIKGKFQSG